MGKPGEIADPTAGAEGQGSPERRRDEPEQELVVEHRQLRNEGEGDEEPPFAPSPAEEAQEMKSPHESGRGALVFDSGRHGVPPLHGPARKDDEADGKQNATAYDAAPRGAIDPGRQPHGRLGGKDELQGRHERGRDEDGRPLAQDSGVNEGSA